MLNLFQQINQRRKALIVVILFTFPCYCLGIFAWTFTPEDLQKDKATPTVTEIISFKSSTPMNNGTPMNFFSVTPTIKPTNTIVIPSTWTATIEPTLTNSPEPTSTATIEEFFTPTDLPTETETTVP